MKKFLVSKKAVGKDSHLNVCFYCREKVGNSHKDECVLVVKTVKIQATIEYDIQVPASWDKHLIEFQRNDGSWCADNMIEELQEIADRKNSCLCNHVKFKCISDEGKPRLNENRN